jgi:hypothetical protein
MTRTFATLFTIGDILGKARKPALADNKQTIEGKVREDSDGSFESDAATANGFTVLSNRVVTYVVP